MLLDRQNFLNLDKKSIPVEEETFNITMPVGVNMGGKELVLKCRELYISTYRASSLISDLVPTLLCLPILVVFPYKGNVHIGFNAMHKN